MHLRKEFQTTAACPHHRGLVECHIDFRSLGALSASWSSSVPTRTCALTYVLVVCPHAIPTSPLPLSLMVSVWGGHNQKSHVHVF